MFLKAELTAFQVFVTAVLTEFRILLNPSAILFARFFVHATTSSQCLPRATPIAISPAMTATAMPTGPLSAANPAASAGAIVMMVPMTEMTFPKTTSSGPTAAAMPATFTIVSFCSSLSPFHLSESDFTTSPTRLKMSVSCGPTAETRSAPIVFSSFIVVVRLVIGSRVPS